MIGVYFSLVLSLICFAEIAFIAADVSSTEKNEQNLDSSASEAVQEEEKVHLRLYYECHCPFCMRLVQNKLKNVIKVLGSFEYLDIKFYPYGNAKTIEKNGNLEFDCQHGPEECYGNKLHACALKHIGNYTDAMLFNICMMQMDKDHISIGSDDAAVARCAREMDLLPFQSFMKLCAKTDEGDQLLKYYGEESKKVGFRGVPYLLINGVRFQHATADLMHDVCALFKNPPEACQ